METLQIIETLTNISGVPATIFTGGAPQRFHPDHPWTKKLARSVPESPLAEKENVRCILTDELLCYGLLRLSGGDGEILFGPLAAIECDNRGAMQILRRYGLPPSDVAELLNYLQHMPVFSLMRFTSFLIFANYVLNRETIDIRDLLPAEYHMKMSDDAQEPTARHKMVIPRNAQDFENMLFSMVRYGQYDKLLEFMNQSVYTGSEGSLATDLIRHRKNLIICSTTLAARHAVAGGLDYDMTMSIADAYIQKVELAPNFEALSVLHGNMLKNYTRLVADRKINNARSAIPVRIRDYIYANIAEKITVQDIATALGRSRGYISTQFHSETGILLRDFIVQLKIDEAKRLLSVTDLSCAAVASQLAFSSESLFLSTFKKVTGLTPRSFRKNLADSPYPPEATALPDMSAE